ncbi:hypothetical protein F5B21DRAFT_504960 [Xylaria acuta]|nr:hypothetical protein F5B21DRAFT_504960 [Xylaria acuta]
MDPSTPTSLSQLQPITLGISLGLVLPLSLVAIAPPMFIWQHSQLNDGSEVGRLSRFFVKSRVFRLRRRKRTYPADQEHNRSIPSRPAQALLELPSLSRTRPMSNPQKAGPYVSASEARAEVSSRDENSDKAHANRHQGPVFQPHLLTRGGLIDCKN